MAQYCDYYNNGKCYNHDKLREEGVLHTQFYKGINVRNLCKTCDRNSTRMKNAPNNI